MTMGALVSLLAVVAATPAAAPSPPPCQNMTWVTLGTGGGPVSSRSRAEPANLLEADGQTIVVDAGDGAAQQLVRAGRSLAQVHTVLLSHLHLDHTAGIAGIIGLRWFSSYPGVLTIYGPAGTDELVAGILASMAPPRRIGLGFGGASAPDPATSVRVVVVKSGDRFNLGAITVRAVENSHYGAASTAAGDISLSYRFDLDRHSITFTGDTGPSDDVTALARGSDMLVSEIIAPAELIEAIKRLHALPADQEALLQQHFVQHHLNAFAVSHLAETARIKRVILTHIAVPSDDRNVLSRLKREVGIGFNGKIDLAHDLQIYNVYRSCG